MQAAQQLGSNIGVTSKQGTATQSEVQTLTGGATSGTFRLRFGTEETSVLTFDDTAADIQAALRALSNISATGVVCAGGALNSAPVTCTFAAEYADVDVPLLQVVSIDLAGGSVTPTLTTAKASTAFIDADMNTVAAMRTRLAAIDGAYYTSARLDALTYNDMVYALRLHDNPQTI